MAISAQQIIANQRNSLKSTGPKTVTGKQIVAGNAQKHGIFSKQPILSDEDPAEYEMLLDDLHAELRPVGVLESSIVERVAVTLWRQKRLVRAETAQIESNKMPGEIINTINKEMNSVGKVIHAEDLNEFDQDNLEWCQSIVHEYDLLDDTEVVDLQKLKEKAPLIYQQLSNEAAEDQQSIEEYINEWPQPQDYFKSLLSYCRGQLGKAEQQPMILALAKVVQNKHSILTDKIQVTFGKYQVMLDNDLYKALKALREAQAWRMETIAVIDQT